MPVRGTAWIIFLFLFSSLALAIGVSPPTANIDWVPNMEGEFEVLLLNSRDIPVQVEFSASGDLSQYFDSTAPVIPARGRAIATVSFAFPAEIDPGSHRQKLHFGEEFIDTTTTAGVAAKTSVTLIAKVFRPYPGRYAEIILTPNHVPAGENTYTEVQILSRGTDAISGDLELHVKDSDDRLIDTVIDADIAVPGNDDLIRNVPFSSKEYDPGKYILHARYDYGSGVATKDASLIIGRKGVLVNDITRSYYKDVTVNKFEVVVESLWNEELVGVYATLQLGAHTGQTPPVTLAPYSKTKLVGYWEADGSLSEGTHTAIITASLTNGDSVTIPFDVQVFNATPVAEEQLPLVNEEPTIVLGFTDVLFIFLCIAILGYLTAHTVRKHLR